MTCSWLFPSSFVNTQLNSPTLFHTDVTPEKCNAHSFRRDSIDQNALRTSPLLLSATGLPLVCHGQLKRRSRQGGFRLTAVSSVFKTLGRTVRPNGQNLRLPLQAVADRRQRGRQDMSAVQIQRGLLQHHLHIYNRWETRRRPEGYSSDVVIAQKYSAVVRSAWHFGGHFTPFYSVSSDCLWFSSCAQCFKEQPLHQRKTMGGDREIMVTCPWCLIAIRWLNIERGQKCVQV